MYKQTFNYEDADQTLFTAKKNGKEPKPQFETTQENWLNKLQCSHSVSLQRTFNDMERCSRYTFKLGKKQKTTVRKMYNKHTLRKTGQSFS